MADVVKKVNLDQFEKKFFQHLNKLRLGNQFCDVRLNVNGTILPCHRVVLVAVCPYFETMFNGNFKESKMNTIPINDVETETFEEILNAMYTGSICLSPSNAFSILKSSHLLQLESIENACESYIIENPKIDYIVDTCVFAQSTKNDDLYWTCIETIVKEVIEYEKTDSFHRIPISILTDIFNEREFSKTEEESILLLILKWSKENKASREDIKKLVSSANLEITEYLNSSLITELLITCDEKRIVDGNKKIAQELDHVDSNLPLTLYLNAIDVKTGQRGWVVLKMNDKMNKYSLSSFNPTNSHFKKVCKVGSKLYCFECFESKEKNVFSCYNDKNRIFLPSPEDKIYEFEMLATSTSIYIMSTNYHFTIWQYDIEQNKWLNIVKEYETTYHNVSACSFSAGIFYIVAEESRHHRHASESIFHIQKNIYSISLRSLNTTQVTPVLPLYNVGENHFIYAFDGKIAVFDVRRDKPFRNTFMIYDTKTNRWSEELKFMKNCRANLNLFHFKDFIYAVENGRAMVPNEKYNIKLNKWINLPSLPKQLTIASTNDELATGEVFGIEIDN